MSQIVRTQVAPAARHGRVNGDTEALSRARFNNSRDLVAQYEWPREDGITYAAFGKPVPV
jgi:hypothetical protein